MMILMMMLMMLIADDDDDDDEGYIYPNLYPQAIAALPAQWMHQWC